MHDMRINMMQECEDASFHNDGGKVLTSLASFELISP